MGELRIGISGWTYAPWRGVFYPAGLRHKDELAYASRQVNSIEINGTFYSLQRPSSYRKWREAAPRGFLFSVKGPRFITHIRRLKEVKEPMARFFASGVLELREKLGPILWQTPPSLRYDPAVLEAFLRLLPRQRRNRPLRHALEIRHASFKNEEFVKMLRRHAVALVVADTAGKWPLMEEKTADFMYVRLHGDEELYASGYTPAALRRWAAKVRAWRGGRRDVFIYFDNDMKVRAPSDAISLSKLLQRHA